MRVLWVFGHLSVQLQQVAKDLTRRRNVSLELMCHWHDRPPVDESVAVTTRLECRRKIDFAAQRTIREKLRTGQFDIAHAYTSRDLASVIGACRGLRIATKIVGYRGTINRLQWRDPGNFLSFWHSRVDRITCDCRATNRALLASRIPPEKLVTVCEGCDPSVFQTKPRSLLDEFNIPRNAFVVGAVASMRPVKGLDLLLRAAWELTDLRDLRLLLIGQVQDSRIPRLAADPRIADRTHLVGWLPDAASYTGLMDVYVSPSRQEGLSMSVMEAMAQEVSLVVSDVGGHTELIRNQVDGLVVPSEDSTALAHAIRRLYDSPQLRRQFTYSAQKRIANEFCVPKWTDRLYRVYCDLVDQPRRAA